MQTDLSSESRTRFSIFTKILWDSYTTFIKLRLSVVGWWMLESVFYGWEIWLLKSDWYVNKIMMVPNKLKIQFSFMAITYRNNNRNGQVMYFSLFEKNLRFVIFFQNRHILPHFLKKHLRIHVLKIGRIVFWFLLTLTKSLMIWVVVALKLLFWFIASD